jgi:hypothetical protein
MQSPQSLGFMPIPAGHGRLFDIEGGPFYAFSGKGVGLCLEEQSVKMGAVTVALDVPDLSTPKPEELDTALAKGANGIDLQAATLSKAVDKSKLN